MTAVPTEHQEHAAVVRWAAALEGRYPELRLLYSIPNGARVRPSVARRMKAEGMKAGVPDLCLPLSTLYHHGLYIEMKRVSGGVISISQGYWITALREQGYRVEVCKGAVDAITVIVEYLDLPRSLIP